MVLSFDLYKGLPPIHGAHKVHVGRIAEAGFNGLQTKREGVDPKLTFERGLAFATRNECQMKGGSVLNLQGVQNVKSVMRQRSVVQRRRERPVQKQHLILVDIELGQSGVHFSGIS